MKVSKEAEIVISDMDRYGKQLLSLYEGKLITDALLSEITQLEKRFRKTFYPGHLLAPTWLLHLKMSANWDLKVIPENFEV